jgi:hypothetical protein
MAISLKALKPGSTDRALLVGMTGSGKTTLARYLLNLRRGVPVLVYDWKGLIRWPGYERLTGLRDFIRCKEERKIYAPGISENNDPDFFDAFFRYCYDLGRVQVYVDEVFAVTDRDTIPAYYHAALTRGRERGLSLYSSTQRPTGIPAVVSSEAEHGFYFRLKLKQDSQRVEEWTGIPRERIAALPKHKFFYSNAEGDTRGPLKLSI